LKDAEADENPDIRAQAGPEARRGEERQAEEERSLSTKAIGQAPGRNQKRGVDDRVRAQHPAEVRQRSLADTSADRREPDVRDPDIEL
jgi:hypothetical protein